MLISKCKMLFYWSRKFRDSIWRYPSGSKAVYGHYHETESISFGSIHMFQLIFFVLLPRPIFLSGNVCFFEMSFHLRGSSKDPSIEIFFNIVLNGQEEKAMQKKLGFALVCTVIAQNLFNFLCFFAACGGYLSGLRGTFSYPNNPNSQWYNSGVSCAWVIQTNPNKVK